MKTLEFKVGDRVQIHPATDAWMQGDRFGDIARLGRFLVHVKMDHSGRVRAFRPESIFEVLER